MMRLLHTAGKGLAQSKSLSDNFAWPQAERKVVASTLFSEVGSNYYSQFKDPCSGSAWQPIPVMYLKMATHAARALPPSQVSTHVLTLADSSIIKSLIHRDNAACIASLKAGELYQPFDTLELQWFSEAVLFHYGG